MTDWVDVNTQLPKTKEDLNVLVLTRDVTPIKVWTGKEYKETGKFETSYSVYIGWWDTEEKEFRYMATISSLGYGSWQESSSIRNATHWLPIPDNPFTGKPF